MLAVSSWRVDSGLEQRGVLKETGAVGAGAVDVGAAVVDNIILRGRLSAGWELMQDGPFARDRDAAFVYGMLGAGADYYFMPLNLYVGATLALAGVSLVEVETRNRPAHALHSKAGVGFDLDVGKEWWVTGNWGMGVALRVRLLSLAPANIARGSDSALTGLQVGAMFSATYN